MHKNRFPKYTKDQKIAALIGYVARNYGVYKTTASSYNRNAKQFGIEHMNPLELNNFEDELIYQKKLHTVDGDSYGNDYIVFHQVLTGEITLRDVVGSNYTDHEWNTKINSGYSPSVENHQWALDLNRNWRRNRRWRVRIVNATNEALRGIIHHSKSYMTTKNYKPKWSDKPNNKTLVMTASDWHIGDSMEADMPNYANRYNWKIAQKRWWKYVYSALHTAKINHVGNIVLVGMGDLVTGAYMRPNNQSAIEFDYSTQVALATKLLVQSLRYISKYYKVSFCNVVGNHDRIGSFRENMYGDSATNIETRFIKLLKIPNVHVITSKDAHDYDLHIQGHRVLFTHGEKVQPNKTNNIQNLEANANIDTLVYAHWHKFGVHSNDCGKLEIALPALKGFDRYNKKITTTVASSGQASILFEKNRTPIVIPVLFDDEK